MFSGAVVVFKPCRDGPSVLTDNFKLNCNFAFLRLFPRHDALKLGKDFAKQTKCSVSDIICLLSLTPQAVLAAQMKTSRVHQTPAYQI